MLVLVVHDVRLYLHIAAILCVGYRVVDELRDVTLCNELSGLKQALQCCVIFNIYQPSYDLQGVFLDVSFRFGLGGVEENLRYKHILCRVIHFYAVVLAVEHGFYVREKNFIPIP